jgi:hypothetical protein
MEGFFNIFKPFDIFLIILLLVLFFLALTN